MGRKPVIMLSGRINRSRNDTIKYVKKNIYIYKNLIGCYQIHIVSLVHHKTTFVRDRTMNREKPFSCDMIHLNVRRFPM